jgi:hypothetical protein
MTPTASDASSLSVYWAKLTIRDSPRARTKARPTSTSLDQAEQVGNGHQDRQDHQKTTKRAKRRVNTRLPYPPSRPWIDAMISQPAKKLKKSKHTTNMPSRKPVSLIVSGNALRLSTRSMAM